ncbi:MAG TPA: hypothetical protein VG900_00900 [Hyphomicrobiaceae bacterium]|jgi:hypothetical protein|nr:hypothetical protein [Hyphomicrobiaceae bacterium]
MNKIAVVCAFALGVAAFASTAPADPLTDLGGYWTGTGSVTLSNGNKERVKCSVVYKVTDNSTQIRQTLRCASQDYSINALAELTLKGAQVSGSWEEKTYSATGQVSGRYTGNAFQLSIEGGNFTAAMNVNISNCKQSISISPQGLEVNSISLGLAKC